MTTENTTGNQTPGKPPRKKRKSGDYRYQMKGADTGAWTDSALAYKGPAEALKAGQGDNSAGTVIRAVRVASPEYVVEAVTTTALKKV